MQTKITFTNESTEFTARIAVFGDRLMALMAANIQNQMITSNKIPFLPKSTKWAQRGALRQSIKSQKVSVGKYKVTAGENSPAGAYAAAQEEGITHGHPIKNYSTPGTGAHWFRDSIETVKERSPEYIKQAQQMAGLEGIE